MSSKDNIQNLIDRKETLFTFLNILEKEQEILSLEKISQSNDFWENQKDAKKTLKKINDLKIWIEGFNKIKINLEELEILHELDAEKNEIETQYIKTLDTIEDLEFKNMLSSEEDNLYCF